MTFFNQRTVSVHTNEKMVNDQALAALAAAGKLYQRAGELVRVLKVLEGGRMVPRIEAVTLPWLRERLSDVAEFLGERGRQHPPDWCMAGLLARGTWEEIPMLSHEVEYPVLRPDGTIFQEPGHDPGTHLLYEPSCAYQHVPERPSLEQVEQSRDRLLDLVCDFPFAQPLHRAAWLAGLLTLFARHAYSGPSPLFLVDGNVRGAGKGLLCDVAALIATGRNMPTSSQVLDEAEERKRITAVARAGDSLMMIDNIAKPFGNAALDIALTSTVWKERLLGQTKIMTFPLFTVWWATGNNVQFRAGADTARRTLHIRLLSPEQNPESRTEFKHPNLRRIILEKRPQLAADCLTLLRAYQVHKADAALKLRSWGSFEDWSDVVRGTLVWAGLPDPIEAHEQLAQMADVTSTALADLVHGWRQMCTDLAVDACTTRQAIEWLAEDLEYKARQPGHQLRYPRLMDGLSELCITNGRPLPDARQLGYTLRSYRGRVVDGMYLEVDGKQRAVGQQWTVKQR